MKPKHAFILCLIVTACKKSTTIPSPPPVAGFSVTADSTGGAILIATYDQYLLTNTSGNADSSHWDFGNDSTSSLQNPVLWYPVWKYQRHLRLRIDLVRRVNTSYPFEVAN